MLAKRKFNWPGLGNIRARIYGLLYVALIPFYAFVYINLPQYSFYHTTTKYEHYLNVDSTQIVSEFKANLVDRLRAVHPDGFILVNGWKIDISDIDVSFLQVTDDSISFGIRMKTMKQVSQPSIVVVGNRFKLTYPGNGSSRILDNNGQIQQYYKIPTFDPPVWKVIDSELDYQAIFPGEEFMKSSQPILILPATLNTRIEDFRRAYKGFPSKVSGNLVRMLYLSAITITTVGYGDILPISPLARVLVASEAVLGVVVIGLFLNALVQTRKKSP
jgi:hypothetical protein